MAEPVKKIDAGRFGSPLMTLAETMVQRIKYDWPQSLSNLETAQTFCRYNLGYCLSVFRAQCGMFTDELRESHRWTWDGVSLLPATNRTLLDCLFNLIFLLEDIESRSIWYFKSGWREQRLEYERLKSEYEGEAEWVEWLKGVADLSERGGKLFKVTEEEFADPKKQIKPWPSSGQMPDYKVDNQNRPPTRQFLYYLSDWFYKNYSGQTHMSFLGMMKLGAVIAMDDLPTEVQHNFKDDGIPRIMTAHMGLSATLLLCVISELQNHFKFTGDIELRLLEMWHVLVPDFPDAKDIFDRRYSSMFPALLISLSDVVASDPNSPQ